MVREDTNQGVTISERDEFKKEKFTAKELKEQNDIVLETLNELLKEQDEKK